MNYSERKILKWNPYRTESADGSFLSRSWWLHSYWKLSFAGQQVRYVSCSVKAFALKTLYCKNKWEVLLIIKRLFYPYSFQLSFFLWVLAFCFFNCLLTHGGTVGETIPSFPQKSFNVLNRRCNLCLLQASMVRQTINTAPNKNLKSKPKTTFNMLLFLLVLVLLLLCLT